MKSNALSLLSEIEVLDDQLLVIQGGYEENDPINCGAGCGLGCGGGCGSGCSGCSREEPQEPTNPHQTV